LDLKAKLLICESCVHFSTYSKCSCH